MFNKEIFDKAKVAYPTSNMTYTQFYQMLRRLKAAGVKNPMVINADFNRMIPFIIANGGRIVDDQLNIAIDDAKGKAAIKQYIELFAKDQLGVEASGVGAGWEGEAFGKEQVALIMTGPWSLGYLKGSFPNVYKKIGVVEMPRGTSKSTMIYTVSWSINRQTKNRAEAITVLKFLVNEGQKIFVDKAGVLGSNKKIAASDTDPIKTAFYKGADYGTPWRILTPSGLFSRANDEINSRIKDAFFGKISVDQMLQQIRQNYDSWVE
jgi:multiple sugar transport system substrate-binding protein